MEAYFHLLDRLLAEHNCVVIPEFGGFIGSYRPARLRVKEGLVEPPGKQLSFNPRLLRQDGLLVDALASREGIGYAEAETRIQSFSEHCKKELQSQRLLRLPGIGKLLLEGGDKIRFAPQEPNAHWQDAFGLPQLALEAQLRSRQATEAAILEERHEPVFKDQDTEPVIMDRWSPRKWGWAAAALLVLFGTWQILVVTSSLPHSMAFLYPSSSRPVVIEEGKAAVLHPLIPSLAKQMERYGQTAPLSAVGPTAVRTDPTDAVVLDPSDNGDDPGVSQVRSNVEEGLQLPVPSVETPQPSAPSQASAAGNAPIAAALNGSGPKTNEASASKTQWRIPLIDGDDGRPPHRGYYVVIGSYRTASLAQARLERCSEYPGPSAILRAPNGNHRAALYLGSDKAAASALLEDQREIHRQKDAWLLRY